MSGIEQLRARLKGLQLSTVPPQETVPDLGPGQLWQLEWDTTALIALVLAVSTTDRVTVIPAGDPEVGDDTTISVPAAESPLRGIGYTLWPDLGGQVPTSVFNLYLGEAPGTILDQVVDGTGRDGRSTFPAISSPLDDRALVRADLEGRLDQLASASWAPAGDRTVDLGEIARSKGLGPARLAEVAHIAPGDALAVLRGTRRLSNSEAAQAADLFGIEPEQLVESARPTIPTEVVSLLDHPRRRQAIRRRAAQRGIGEGEARREIAEQLLSPAARTTGSGTPDWDTLIDDVLRD